MLDDQEEYAEATITKVDAPQLTLSGVLDAANLSSVTTGGDAGWEPVESVDAKVGGSCAQSGAVGMEQSSYLEATVQGKGTLTFWWKVSCEPDPRGRHSYDNLSFTTNGVEIAWIDGETGWTQTSVTFDTAGAHELRWTYSTDDWEEPGYSDCGWVDAVTWTPSAEDGVVVDAGGGKTVTVPTEWFTKNNTARAVTDAAANGRKVWECYVLGLDPEDATKDFKITAFPMNADGTPDLENLAFAPSKDKWNVQGARAVIKGKARIDDATETWQTATEENKGELRFFRVEVELP